MGIQTYIVTVLCKDEKKTFFCHKTVILYFLSCLNLPLVNYHIILRRRLRLQNLARYGLGMLRPVKINIRSREYGCK